MVTRILSGKSIRGLLNYNENKVKAGNAELVLANKFGAEILDLEFRDKLRRFEELTVLNDRAKTNAIHVMLNFDKDDRLSREKLQLLAVDYMGRIGFGEQPFLVYQHRDAYHPHIHIVTTNIQQTGERIPIHNIGRDKDEKIRLAIQNEYGLIKAESRVKDLHAKDAGIRAAEYGEKPARQSIYNIVTPVLREYKFTSLTEYNAVLKCFNVLADRGPEDSIMFGKRGLVYSIVDVNGKRIGIPFKASSFAGNPGLAKIESKFLRNQEKRKRYAEPLKEVILKVLAKPNIATPADLLKALDKTGISLIFRRSKDGKIYGLTYVDHNSRCVFNGSDLGKNFSAKAILELLGQNGSRTTEMPHPLHSTGNANFNNTQNAALDKPGPHREALLEFLFEKPIQEPARGVAFKRKKKKKKRISKTNDLSNQI